MATIASLDVLLTANVSPFAAGLGAAGSKLTGFAAGPIALAVQAGQALTGVFKSTLDALLALVDRLDEAGDKAANLGVAVDELTRLHFAAEKLGSSGEVLDKALGQLQKRMPDIASNTGPAAEAIQALGLSTEAFARLDPATAFRMVVSEMDKLPASADKLRVAYGLFGKGAGELFSLLTSGNAVLDEQRRRSDELGATITAAEAAAGDAAKGGLIELSAAWEGLLQQLIKFEPILTTIVELLTKALTKLPALLKGMGPLGLLAANVLEANEAIESTPAAIPKGPSIQQQIDDLEKLHEQQEAAREAQKQMEAEAKVAAKEAASAAAHEAADALREQERAARDAIDAQEALAEAGRDVWTATRTPAEAATIELERLNGLFAKGVLDAEAFTRRLEEMRGELAGNDRPTLQISAGAALEAGTSAAVSALIESRTGRADDARQLTKQQLVEQQRAGELLERIAQAIEELTDSAVTIGAT